MTLPGYSGKVKIILFTLMLTVPLSIISYLLFTFAEDKFTVKACKCRTGRVFIASFLFIVLCRIPILLAYYPAVMSYDFGRQITEAVKGHIWFWDYQPLIHTEMIRIFYLVGMRLGSIETGMALLSIFQILVVSAVMAYTVCLILRVTGSVKAVIILTVIYARLPLHQLISVIMTKDVLFAAFFVLLICLLYERTLKKNLFLDICIILTAVLNITFRKNSVYALFFLLIGYIFYEKKVRDKLLSTALVILCIVSGLGAHKAMVVGFDVIRGDNSEMYSVPMQQFMRTYVNQRENLTNEQLAMIEKVLPLEEEGISYDPFVSDAVKNYSGFRHDIWKGGPGPFMHEWIALFKAYPNEFIDAFLCLNRGYWYIPDRVFAEVFGVGAENEKGVLHTYNCTYGIAEIPGGIKSTCYIPFVRHMYEQIINENGFFTWPVLNLLFRPAVYFWVMMFTVFFSLMRKKRLGLVILTYPLFYTATLFFGPLVYIRYMYPLILSVPVLMALVFCGKE